MYNILVVDKDVDNLNALKRALRQTYNVLTATNEEAAFSTMAQNEIALVIVDYRMPDMTGVEFIERVIQKYLDVTYILLVTDSDEKLSVEIINASRIYRRVTKPWEPEEIKVAVKEGVEVYEATHSSRNLYTRTLLNSGVISAEQLDNALKLQRSERRTIADILLERNLISRHQLSIAEKMRQSERKPLGEALINIGAISRDDLNTARELQEHGRRRLSEIIVDLGYASEEDIFSCYALHLGMPYVSLDQYPGRAEIIEMLPAKLAHKHNIIPVDSVGPVLVVASSEPLDENAKNEIELETKHKVMAVCTSYHNIKAALRQSYPDENLIGDEQ